MQLNEDNFVTEEGIMLYKIIKKEYLKEVKKSKIVNISKYRSNLELLMYSIHLLEVTFEDINIINLHDLVENNNDYCNILIEELSYVTNNEQYQELLTYFYETDEEDFKRTEDIRYIIETLEI